MSASERSAGHSPNDPYMHTMVHTHHRTIPLLAFVALCATAALTAPATTTITSGDTSITLDTTKGTMTSLVAGGRELLAGPTPTFRMQITTGTPKDLGSLKSYWRGSGSAKAVRAERPQDKLGLGLKLHYEQIDPGIDVEVRFMIAGGDSGVFTWLAATNRSPHIIEQIIFPDLRLKPAFGGECVDVGRVDQRVPVAPQHVGAKPVHDEQNHVRWIHQ